MVDLSSNQLVSIPDRSFSSQRRLEQLRELGLGQNRIRQISGSAFSGLTHLAILDLSDNLLEAVPGEALAALPSLAELNLSQNNIRVLADSSFSGLLQLSTLDMSGNKLERLNIGQNKFSAIDEGAFLNLQRLKELHISGCPNLVEVAAEAFAQLADLQTLTLSSNRKLSFIHPQAFGSISGLRSVDLSSNGLASVSSSLLAWTSLTSVDLSGNPWQCDCDLSFLQTAILTAVNRSEAVRVVRCWNPPNLRDRDVTSLDLDCSLVQSPSTGVSGVQNMEIIAIIVTSITVILLVLIFLILYTRKMLVSWFKARFFDSDRGSVNSGRILQYEPYQDPDYIQQRSVTLARPSLTNHQSLVRNEHYFATLAKQEGSRTINQGYLRQNLHNNATKNNKSPIATCEDWIYWKDPKQEEPHLNILENPLTEI